MKFKASHGRATLEPVKFTGNTVSLQGTGTIDPQADLDLRLRLLYGRDEPHIPGPSELAGQFLQVHVHGPLMGPKVTPEFLPAPSPPPPACSAG